MLAGIREESWDRERLLEALDGYNRGIGDAPLVRKWTESELDRETADENRPIAFVISTDEVDRHGDGIVAEGWQVESYLYNPVFLWAHDYTRPVIGRAMEVWKEPHQLLARMEFAPTEFAQEVAMLYRAGYQRGVSVGFKPLRYEERRHDKTGAFLGIRFLEQELLEASAVPVPANRNALRKALDQAPLVGEYLRRTNGGGTLSRDRPPKIATAAEAIWPELAARVDDLGKLVEELAQMVEEPGLFGNTGPPRSELTEVLGVLRGARG